MPLGKPVYSPTEAFYSQVASTKLAVTPIYVCRAEIVKDPLTHSWITEIQAR